MRNWACTTKFLHLQFLSAAKCGLVHCIVCLNLRVFFSEKLEQMLFAGSLLPPMSCLFKNLCESFLACRMDIVQVAEQCSAQPSFVFLCAIPTFFCVYLCILLYCICACVIVLWRNFRVVQQLHDRINRSFETVIREHILFVQLVDNSIVASQLVPASHSLQECVVMLTKWNTRA